MDPENNQERSEVFERIPWEMLDQKKGDRQWIMFAVAGAVVLGVLAYSFMSNRSPVQVAVAETVSPAPPATPAAPFAAVPQIQSAQPPVVVAEADLYAVDPERLVDQAVAHAEWFAIEYFTMDGLEEQSQTLSQLLPAGIPLPTAVEGTRVFVEWAGATAVRELGSLSYEVDVLVRYLLAQGDDAYRRQPPMTATVQVAVGDSGPRVILPPSVVITEMPGPQQLVLVDAPPEVAETAVQLLGGGEVFGARQTSDGFWSVVVVTTDANGVTRPVSVTVP